MARVATTRHDRLGIIVVFLTYSYHCDFVYIYLIIYSLRPGVWPFKFTFYQEHFLHTTREFSDPNLLILHLPVKTLHREQLGTFYHQNHAEGELFHDVGHGPSRCASSKYLSESLIDRNRRAPYECPRHCRYKNFPPQRDIVCIITL